MRRPPESLWRMRLALWCLCGALAGCAAPPFDTKAMVQDWAQYMQRDYQLKPGDKVAITVYQHQELTQEVIVSPQGTIDLRRVPESIRALDISMGTFRQLVQEKYAEVVDLAEVSVSLVDVAVNSVYVAGEVRRPGPVPYGPSMTISQAIFSAGGFDLTAKCSDVRVIRNRAGVATTYRIDVADVLLGSATDFLVLPGDVIFAQTSTIADLGNLVELYIRRLLPFAITGVSLGN